MVSALFRGASGAIADSQGGIMQPLRILRILGLVSAVGLISSMAFGATITGRVTGPDGAPFRAAFVQARNAKTRVTVIVLSGNDGKYRMENLPAGDYQVLAKSVGYRSDPQERNCPVRESKRDIRLDAAKADGALGRNSDHSGDRSVSGGARQRQVCALRIELPRLRAVHQCAARRKRMARRSERSDVDANRRQRGVRHDQERSGRQ